MDPTFMTPQQLQWFHLFDTIPFFDDIARFHCPACAHVVSLDRLIQPVMFVECAACHMWAKTEWLVPCECSLPEQGEGE